MDKNEWLIILKGYYRNYFNQSIKELTEESIEYNKKYYSKIIPYEVEEQRQIRKQKKFESRLNNFINQNYEMLENFLKLGFKVIEIYDEEENNKKFKNKKLIRKDSNGFSYEIDFLFYTENFVHVSIIFPRKINGISGICHNFNYKNIKELKNVLNSLLKESKEKYFQSKEKRRN